MRWWSAIEGRHEVVGDGYSVRQRRNRGTLRRVVGQRVMIIGIESNPIADIELSGETLVH